MPTLENISSSFQFFLIEHIKDSWFKKMSGKTRNNIYRKSIGIDAQTLPDIFTLSFIYSIRKTKKALDMYSKVGILL